jgi:hypothetical protein
MDESRTKAPIPPRSVNRQTIRAVLRVDVEPDLMSPIHASE